MAAVEDLRLLARDNWYHVSIHRKLRIGYWTQTGDHEPWEGGELQVAYEVPGGPELVL